jgi:hypothetical protein
MTDSKPELTQILDTEKITSKSSSSSSSEDSDHPKYKHKTYITPHNVALCVKFGTRRETAIGRYSHNPGSGVCCDHCSEILEDEPCISYGKCYDICIPCYEDVLPILLRQEQSEIVTQCDLCATKVLVKDAFGCSTHLMVDLCESDGPISMVDEVKNLCPNCFKISDEFYNEFSGFKRAVKSKFSKEGHCQSELELKCLRCDAPCNTPKCKINAYEYSNECTTAKSAEYEDLQHDEIKKTRKGLCPECNTLARKFVDLCFTASPSAECVEIKIST